MMDTTSSTTMQSLGEIEQRAPAVGVKIWCNWCLYAGIKFTHRPKIRFFTPQGWLVAPIHVKLGRADGHVGPLGCAKFYLNHHRGVGMRPPKYQKFPLFGKESSRRGNSLDDSKIFRGFYTLNYPTLVFQISCDSLHRLQSYWWETMRPSIMPNFLVYPVGKTMH